MSLFDSLGQLWSRKSPSKKSAPRRQQRKGDSKRGLLFEGLEERSLLAITQIALSDFIAPQVLDFQSVPTGPIAGNAAAFQAIGISSVVGTSDADVDSYSTGSPTASRALAATSTGLRVIDPNSSNASDRFGNNNTYTINFAQPQTKFGFTNDDSGGTGFTFNIVLFSGATQVDSGSLSAPVFGQNPLFFSSTVAFDRVVISNSLGDGFVIDNLTTEAPAPTITAPTFINVTEDVASPLTGISFTAAGTGSVTTTFSVPSGTLTATSGGSVTVNGSGTGSLTLDGTTADINAFISGSNLKFQTALNQTSSVTLSIGINDNGAVPQTASTTVALNVNPVNDNPVNTVPFISTNEDTPVNVTGFSISDVDSTGPFSVNVRFNNVVAGILTFRTDVPGGLTASNILNNGTPNTTILGATLVAINTTLSATGGLVYTPAHNFNGFALFAVDTNSDGNGGSDVADTATWTVSAVNDAPTITAPATYSTQQGIATSLTGISFADVDAGGASVSVQLDVASGTLTAAASGSVTVGGSGTGLVTLSGTITNINTYLSASNLSYANSSRGAIALTIAINDNGNSGSGGAQTTTSTSTINVVETPSLVVTTDNDGSTPFDGLISLREAIAYANSLPGADTITFGDGTATGGTNFLDGIADTITISAIGDGTAGPSAFGITSDITVQGNATTGITLQGGGSSSNTRAFYVSATGVLSIENLTINGFRHEGGGSNRGGGAAGMGGAIFVNGGTLNLLATTIANNVVQGGGFGSFSDGGGGLGGDAIGQFGGGGPNPGGGDINNGASGGFGGGGNAYGGNGGFGGAGAFSGTGGFGGGGGAFTAGGFGGGNGTLFGAGGGAGMGGAIFSNGGTINITNSTFQGNSAFAGALLGGSGQSLGGVLFARNGTVTINNSTLSGNTAANGGQGVYILSDASNGGNNTSPGSGSATAIINNTIIGQTDNSVSDFVANTNAGGATPVTSGVGNLIRTAVGFNGTIVSSADPQLAALANNGGPTPTMALAVSSPARNAGSDLAIPNGVMTDQRGTGFDRIFGGTVDIGAFEFSATAPTVSGPSAINVGVTTATLGGNVTDDGGATITERGIVWSVTALNNNPQLGGASVTTVPTTGTTGVFTIDVTALPSGKQISFAAYATNVAGTSYSTVGTFTTAPAVGQLGGVTVQVIGNQLVITGDNKPDRLKLTGTANPNEFIVSGLYGTVVNGVTNSSITAQGITSIQWNLTNGGDLIVMDNANVAGNVTIGGGSGANGIALGSLGPVRVGGNLAIDGGLNNGSIVVSRTTTVGGMSIIGGLGSGQNSITMSNSTIGTNLSIIGGPGPDQIQQTQVTVNGQWNISASSGNDVIAVNSCIAIGAATFNSGLGADVIAVSGGRFDAGLALDGSAGSGVKKLSMSGVVYTGTATFRGGEQNDLVVLTGSLGGNAVFDMAGGHDSVLVQYSILDELYAALGDGNDVFNLRGNRLKGLTSLDGGPGTNALINTGNIFQGPLQRNRI